MEALCQALLGLKEIQQLCQTMDAGSGYHAGLSGLSGVHQAQVAALLRRQTGRPVIVVTQDEQASRRMAADLSAFCGEPVRVLTPRELNFYNAESVSRRWEHQRMNVLYALAAGQAGLVCCDLEALLLRTMPPQLLREVSMTLEPGQEIPIEVLIEQLTLCGYKRSLTVEGPGQFAVRGGIVDFYSPHGESAVRMEFFGDEIDTISEMDTDTQRRGEALDRALLLPAAEVLPMAAPGGLSGLAEQVAQLRRQAGKKPGNETLEKTLAQDEERLREQRLFPALDRYMALVYPAFTTALDYLPEDALVIIQDHARLAERQKNLLWQHQQDLEVLLENGTLSPQTALFYQDETALYQAAEARNAVFLDQFAGRQYPLKLKSLGEILAKQLPSYGGSVETAVSDIQHYQDDRTRVLVLCQSELRARTMQEILTSAGVRAAVSPELIQLPEEGAVTVSVGALSAGFEYPALALAVITEGQMIARSQKRRRSPKRERSNRQKLTSYTDLAPGDLVVHEYHGIGQFAGIVKMKVDEVDRDYIKIQYAGSDSLYVPVTQLNLVSKYIGAGEGASVRLHKLGGAEWTRAKLKAKAAAKDLADGLIDLYARRRRQPGFAFPEDSEWQTEFEESFEFEETEDQLRCIREIKQDMQAPVPMDRLLCGDVGFGKTEVALRAVMKCVLGGKQAAILVPTTVLARQHYLTARRRFSGYPVTIDLVSRQRTAAQQKQTLQLVQEGRVDVLVGTHRLLQKDIHFKNLGLLIVDEEQRFGVTHKERLKEIASQVDVLTLTATPIPRTLNMALSGIRDMSTLEDPPRDRHPVQTYVLEHDWSMLTDAMRRELGRGGQVYYLHNRVESIRQTAARIQKLLPDATIGIAHGKMDQEELGEIMQSMADGDLQVLVCTTIIETGIDIPNVNTLIIEDADRMGLAQLHQIRGRVGRSARHAYAYLTFRRGRELTEVAEKRLSAIREFAEFGSGFKIAMRDLEIRGAGNVLGAQQSGHMMSVGYDMYLKLLEEAVLESGGETAGPAAVPECSADLSIPAGIPDGYVPSAELRMDLYRRIAALQDDEEASELVDELVDRFGDVPGQVDNLIRIALLRADAAQAGFSEISQKGRLVSLRLREADLRRVSAVCGDPAFRQAVLFHAGQPPVLSLRLAAGEQPLRRTRQLVAAYAATRPADASAGALKHDENKGNEN